MSTPVEQRRRLVGALGAIAASGCLPSTAAAAPKRQVLARSLSQMAAEYDVVVIGSGYGGAVMAARLAPGRRLAVLERGREWPPADFPSSMIDVLGQFRGGLTPFGLFDYRLGQTMDVLVGSGLGGTSLINANVVAAADRDAFNAWPAKIRQDVANGVFAGYEARVKQMLGADQVIESDALRKHWFHRSTTLARTRQGVSTQSVPLPIAVNLRKYNNVPNAQGVKQPLCSRCGDCVTGCRTGAKNTLDVNYLPLARAGGAEIFTRVEVDWLEHLADGRWRVHTITRPDGVTPVHGEVIAGSVVLAAGTLGSTQILLRSRAQGLALSSALGTRFSGNGDLIALGYNTSVQTNVMGFGTGTPLAGEAQAGPTITIAADYRAQQPLAQRYLIEDAAVPRALVDAVRLALPLSAGIFTDFPAAQRVARDLLYSRTDGALNHSMVYLGIGHDSASGRIQLDAWGNAQVVWPNVMQEPFVARLKAEMERHALVFGGRYVDYPRTSPIFGGALTTVHPLGGCPMGEQVDSGVVNAEGQVFDARAGGAAVYSNLRVVDGSIAPASIGVNPLLTIAALAERAAEHFA
ncbi:GMC oxidoreductase [Ideonella sp.]|uniref:GMC oxidoreductase n=1 Tax=Ideonella sp. TaxID=1929293 RepID=UPI0035B35D41